jgi:G patch domain-containing protein 2
MKETVTVAVGSSGVDASSEKVVESISSKVGTFEMHTKGFGSKVISQMGFIEGTCLGKDGRSGVWIYRFICII